MSYMDKSMVALRHIGRHRFSATGIGAWRFLYPVMTGTLGATPTEAQIVTGGRTVIITLTNGTWLAAGSDFNTSRQQIINGFTASGSEALGWNTVVRDVMAVTCVARTSATVCTVTFPATATYDITANETITFTVPPTAVLKGCGSEIGNVRPVATAA